MDGTIEMLTHSSAPIRNFRDPRSITDVGNDRLTEIHDTLQWFIKTVKQDKLIRNKEKHLISYQERTY